MQRVTEEFLRELCGTPFTYDGCTYSFDNGTSPKDTVIEFSSRNREYWGVRTIFSSPNFKYVTEWTFCDTVQNTLMAVFAAGVKSGREEMQHNFRKLLGIKQ